MGMVIEEHDQVRPRAGLDARCDARLQIVTVDGLVFDFDAQRFLGFSRQFGLKVRVAGGNEVVPSQPVYFGCLRECRSLVRMRDGVRSYPAKNRKAGPAYAL